MGVYFNRDVFFDRVRGTLFGGSLDQGQVDGLGAILSAWEEGYGDKDLRWLAYALGTQLHETASTCQPIEEYQGSSASYGQLDQETGQRYFGRGYVQLTHRANYEKADIELGLGRTKADETSCEWHAENALDPTIAAQVMFEGMIEGWFRTKDGKPETLARYFDADTNDPYNARGIINGDKSTVPSWSNGVSIGNLIKGYHNDFVEALEASAREVGPLPEPEVVTISIDAPVGIEVVVVLNKQPFTAEAVAEEEKQPDKADEERERRLRDRRT